MMNFTPQSKIIEKEPGLKSSAFGRKKEAVRPNMNMTITPVNFYKTSNNNFGLNLFHNSRKKLKRGDKDFSYENYSLSGAYHVVKNHLDFSNSADNYFQVVPNNTG